MNGITQPRSSFEPTSRDYALTSALQSANPFNTGSLYRNDWDAWKQGVANRFTVAGGMEMVATSAAFFGINRFTMPRITGALNRSGVRGFWLPLLLSSTALSMVTSGLMTMMTLVRAGDSGRDNLNQWMIGLLYSVPSTMLGMGGSQIFRNISQFLIFDIGTEGVQALSSAGIGSILESTGLQAKRDLTTWQRVRQEFVDGVMYFGVGRGVGAAIPKVPGVVARIQQTYGNPAYEVGAAGDLTGLPSSRKTLTPAQKAQRDLVKILKSKRKRGLTPERVPYTSEVELRVKKVREGKVEGSGVGDGDTVEVITAGLTQSVPLRLILVNSTEAMGGSGHPETKCGRGELGALEAYWFLNDLTEMHGEIVRARYYRSDAYGRPIVHLFAETKRGIWLDLNRAMVESGHAHVFYVAPNITGKLVRFLGIQQEAQAKGIGIWQYPHYRRGLHITSIRTFTKDAEAHPHLEFVRVANLHSDRAIQLEGIQIHNGSMRGMLPNLLLQPGHVVKVLLCGGKYNDNTNQELVITVREAKKNKGHPLLDSKQPVELLEPGPNGKPISIHIPGSEANQLVPPEFRHEREAGLHLMALNPLQHIKGFHDLKENVRLYNHSEAEVDLSGWTVKQGEKTVKLPDGTKIPPYRAIQLFTCRGQTVFDTARRLRLYLGATTVDEPLWRNDRPIVLIDPKGIEISMEAATPEARRLVPKKFLKRKGAV